MTKADMEAMDLDELRRYMLSHRDDTEAFYCYIDRSKASGRMITIDPGEPNWEEQLDQKIQQAVSKDSN